MAKEIPVYLFTGFLDAGKTRFAQQTLEDKSFNNGDRILLLLCEGHAHHSPSRKHARILLPFHIVNSTV